MTRAGLEKRPGGDSDAENARRAARGQGRRRGFGAWPAKRESRRPCQVWLCPGFFQAQEVRMNVGRRAGVRGAASTLGKDLAGAVEDLPAQIEIPRDVVRALARAEEPPSFVKRFLAEGAGS